MAALESGYRPKLTLRECLALAVATLKAYQVTQTCRADEMEDSDCEYHVTFTGKGFTSPEYRVVIAFRTTPSKVSRLWKWC
jgi:20S proteasome alpha/beta subunit